MTTYYGLWPESLVWLPVYCGVEGNEIALDKGLRLTPSGLKPFCGLGKDQYKAAVQQWELNNSLEII